MRKDTFLLEKYISTPDEGYIALAGDIIEDRLDEYKKTYKRYLQSDKDAGEKYHLEKLFSDIDFLWGYVVTEYDLYDIIELIHSQVRKELKDG